MRVFISKGIEPKIPRLVASRSDRETHSSKPLTLLFVPFPHKQQTILSNLHLIPQHRHSFPPQLNAGLPHLAQVPLVVQLRERGAAHQPVVRREEHRLQVQRDVLPRRPRGALLPALRGRHRDSQRGQPGYSDGGLQITGFPRPPWKDP